MRKLVVITALLAFVSTATAQDMAMEQAESVASYLDLNENQKEAVYKLYKAAADEQRQKWGAAMAARKSSDREKARAAQEKITKSKETRPTPKHSKRATPKSTMSSSERFLMIAYRRAESNPALKQELQNTFTQKQAEKWHKIGKK